MKTQINTDRAAGVMLGLAAGDALGAGYEFGPPFEGDVVMAGGGSFNWAPGEWTDDTSMAVPILRGVASGRDLRDEEVLDEIVAAWVDWAKTAPDVGIQLSAILRKTEPTASAIRKVARVHHERNGRSAGNGSLMRTAPVALAYLNDPEALAEAARAISDLTHFEEDAGDACVLWCLAIRHAVLTGELDVRVGLDALPAPRRERWDALIGEAEAKRPRDFEHNGWVVEAFQAAWSSLVHLREILDVGHTRADFFRQSLENAVRGGRDTDTVAAIAGSLAGAAYGASAVPAEWRRIIHGRPGLRGTDLVRFAVQAVAGEAPAEQIDYTNWGDVSALVQHPHDPGVWLGGVGSLGALPDEVDAVVSLCRVGTKQVPAHIREHLEVRLIDRPDLDENPNLRFVLGGTVDAIAALRAEGRTVLVHCVQAHSRTPTVGVLYATRHLGVPPEQALREVLEALPGSNPNSAFRTVIATAGLPGGF